MITTDEKIELYGKVVDNIRKQFDNICELLPEMPMEDKIFFTYAITEAVTAAFFYGEDVEQAMKSSCAYRYKFRHQIKELSPTPNWWFDDAPNCRKEKVR